MAKILVIGGGGFYGRRIVDGLTARGYEASVGGRSGPTRIDLSNQATFDVLTEFDLVINAADGLLAPPDALASYCLEHGHVMMDLSADNRTVDQLLGLNVEGASGHHS